MGRVTDRRTVLHVDAAAKTAVRRPDTLSAEEPLEIRVGPARVGPAWVAPAGARRPAGAEPTGVDAAAGHLSSAGSTAVGADGAATTGPATPGAGRAANASTSSAAPTGAGQATDPGTPGAALTDASQAANASTPSAAPTDARQAADPSTPNAAPIGASVAGAGVAGAGVAAPGPAGRGRRPLAVTMRTPGDDLDLALGFLLTEGVIRDADDVVTAQLCAGTDTPNTYNVVDVVLADGVPPPDTDPSRSFYTTSSCGVCGKASIDAIRTRSRWSVKEDPAPVDATILASLPDRLRTEQRTFARTGGLHAAGLFTLAGELLVVREDVGRHNAVDKVVGWAARDRRLPLTAHILLVSGRASFELTQKAWMAGIPVLAAVSAPSTLAVDLAEEAGMTLVGFLRGDTMNVYAGEHRIVVS